MYTHALCVCVCVCIKLTLQVLLAIDYKRNVKNPDLKTTSITWMSGARIRLEPAQSCSCHYIVLHFKLCFDSNRLQPRWAVFQWTLLLQDIIWKLLIPCQWLDHSKVVYNHTSGESSALRPLRCDKIQKSDWSNASGDESDLILRYVQCTDHSVSHWHNTKKRKALRHILT